MYFFFGINTPLLPSDNPTLSPPVPTVLVGRVRFGYGNNLVMIRSSQPLTTPPGLQHFTYLTETMNGNYRDYTYVRTDVVAPELGEGVGLSAENSFIVLSPAINEAGLEQNVVLGTYQLYGWIGEMNIAFTTAYSVLAALTNLQRQSLVDPGVIVARSDGVEGAPGYLLCDSAGVAQSAPAATHIKITNAEIMNASGTLDLILTSI